MMKKQCLTFLINLMMATTPLFAQFPAQAPSTNRPVFIVDSAVVENMSDLRPEDIDSVTVLKGQDADSAAARFGKSATGGVVLIKTKNPRHYIPITDLLLLHQIQLTSHILVMVDQKLIADPAHYRLDTSKPVQVYIENIHRLNYIDSLYKQLKIVKIVTGTQGRIQSALEGRLRSGPPPAGEHKRVIYIRGDDLQSPP